MVASTPLSGIRACVFDAYGTLLDVNAAAESCRDVLGDQTQDLAMLWRQKQLEYTWLRSLMNAFQDFWHVTGQSLDYALERLQRSDDVSLRARLMALYFELKAHPDSKPCLTKLKNTGMKTAILSNASVAMLTSAVRHAGLNTYLDKVLSVDALKIFKPHERVYNLACESFNIEPHDVCFISSNAWDVAGASHFGFQVIWLNRGGGQLEQLGPEPKAEISTLAELPDLIDA